jgi:glycosyltransferase involved in cell wall biosynthesis
MGEVFNIKIAQVCHRYSPYLGGIETHVEEISERLQRKGFEVEVLTVDAFGRLPRDYLCNNVRVKSFRSFSPHPISKVFYPSWNLCRYLLKNSSEYDIVHAHNYHAFPAFYASQAKSSNKFVFTPHYHGAGSYFLRNMLHIPYKFLGRRIFEKADRIVCVSEYEKSLVSTNLGVELDKIVVIPNGVDLDQFKDVERKTKRFKSILFVGRLEKYKGIQYILETLPKLDSDVILEIVGVGPYKGKLINLASSLGIEKRVNFFNNLSRNQLLQKYVDADVFVLLSSKESYGITVAEALLSRTTCIVSKSSALREWVDKKNCFGIDTPPNIDELRKLINKIIGKSVDEESVRKRVLSWDLVTEKLIKIYESLKNNT